MAKLTIAQLREKDVIILASYDKRINVTIEEKTNTARHIMNRFYRYVGLRVRNVYDDNDANRHNKAWHFENEQKEERLLKRLDADIYNLYGLNLTFAGIYPHIGRYGVGHCIDCDIIYGHYYN